MITNEVKTLRIYLYSTASIEKGHLKINLENYLVWGQQHQHVPFLILRYIYGENQALRRADLFCSIILGQS